MASQLTIKTPPYRNPPRPAHFTKSLSFLSYPLRPSEINSPVLSLKQTSGKENAEATTGTTLWLSAQAVSLYLIGQLEHGGTGWRMNKGKKKKCRGEAKNDLYTRKFKITADGKKPKAIELGAGIGLTSLVLSSLGIDVLATDVELVLNGVLRENLTTNEVLIQKWVADYRYCSSSGGIVPSVLDWNTFEDGTHHTWPEGLKPPFDFIVTTDTLYHSKLSRPLLSTLQSLSELSIRENGEAPIVILGLERRDSELIDDALEEARRMGFKVEQVLQATVLKLLAKAGMVTENEKAQTAYGEEWEEVDKDGTEKDWEGVEIWKMKLHRVDG